MMQKKNSEKVIQIYSFIHLIMYLENFVTTFLILYTKILTLALVLNACTIIVRIYFWDWSLKS